MVDASNFATAWALKQQQTNAIANASSKKGMEKILLVKKKPEGNGWIKGESKNINRFCLRDAAAKM